MPVVLETENCAVSAAPLGTVAGVQLVAVFQSPLGGLRFQVALPALTDRPSNIISRTRDRTDEGNTFDFIPLFQGQNLTKVKTNVPFGVENSRFVKGRGTGCLSVGA